MYVSQVLIQTKETQIQTEHTVYTEMNFIRKVVLQRSIPVPFAPENELLNSSREAST